MTNAEFPVALLLAVMATSLLLILLGRSAPQGLRTILVIGALGGFVGIARIDGAMESHPGEPVVRKAFAIPIDVPLTPIGRTKTPVCWAKDRNLSSTADFSQQAWERHWAKPGAHDAGLVDGIAHYLGVNPANIVLAPQATAWQKPDLRHSVDGAGKLWPMEYAEHVKGQTLCLDIDAKPNPPRTYSARACDPLDETAPQGNVARIVAIRMDDTRKLRIAMHFARPPAQCENRARHTVNRWLGLKSGA